MLLKLLDVMTPDRDPKFRLIRTILGIMITLGLFYILFGDPRAPFLAIALVVVAGLVVAELTIWIIRSVIPARRQKSDDSLS